MEYKNIVEIEKENLTFGFTTDKDCFNNPITKNIEEEDAI